MLLPTVAVLVTPDRFPIALTYNRGKVINRRDAKKELSCKEDAIRRDKGSNPSAGKEFFLRNLS